MSDRIRVLVWYRCRQPEFADFVARFHAIGTQLVGVPGLLGSELLGAHREEGSLVVMSEWESMQAFATWEVGHQPTTEPLREYQDTTRPYRFELYHVVASPRLEAGIHGRTTPMTTDSSTPPASPASSRCPYPFQRPSALGIPEELATVREHPTVPVTLPSGDDALLVTRYADVRKLLTDNRLSRNLERPGAAQISRDNRMFSDPRMNPDPPEHTRVRSLVLRAFTGPRVERLRPYVEGLVDELLDAMEQHGGPVDLNETLAFPLPMRVLCKLLGVPDDDLDSFRNWTDHFVSIGRFGPDQIRQAAQELSAYIAALIEAKRAEPGDDLISGMIKATDADNGRLTAYQLQWWCRLLLLVGYETTATQFGGGVAMLLSHPDQLARLRADYSLIPGAIEELLRWKLVGSSVLMLRYAVADIPMDGYTIPAGTSVIPAVDSANQDETVFDQPTVFDITRTSSAGNLTLSLGTHSCIGASLGRLQLQIATERLLRRFPDLRLARQPSELRRHEGTVLEAFTEILVDW
jgi:cytochrome P450/heme-degrading monooxygenase HmoA